MQALLYYLALAVVASLQALPLRCAALLGRAGGEAVYWVDGRHRRMAVRNLTRCFGEEMSPAEIRALARENFRRIGETYCCAVKTASMKDEQIRAVLTVQGGHFLAEGDPERPESRVLATGHFGNFEVCARLHLYVHGYRTASTYRGLRQPRLDRLLYSLRARSGCRLFERRKEADELKQALGRPGLLLGLFADQNAGPKGVQGTFFGMECSTTAAPALFALRYGLPLHTAICFRTGLGRWRLEIGRAIPTRENGRARSVEAISMEMNKIMEAAVRRDPANWFWVHNRWKEAGGKASDWAGKRRSGRLTEAAKAEDVVE